MPDTDTLTDRLRETVLGLAGFTRYAAERFATRQTLRVAASLSYTSLLALVPLAAIGVAVMSAFPVFDSAQDELGGLIFTYIAPHAGVQVEEYLDRFVGNTAQLTTVGVVGLGVTTLLLLATIESAFNVIWGIAERRSLLTRLLAYWTTVTLGPLMLGAGISLSTYLFAVDLAAFGLGGMREALLGLLPVLLTAVGFTILYVALPARSVRWSHAIVGAIIAALLFEGLKKGFGVYVGAAGGFSSIYGPLAALPLFLMWMYFAWAVILFGAVIAAAWPEWQALRRERLAPATPVRQMMRAILVLQMLRDAGEAGRSLVDEDLLEATGGNNVALGNVLAGLREQGLVARTESGAIVLARDLDGVTLHHLRDALGLGLGELGTADVGEADWLPDFDRIIRQWHDTEKRALDMPVKALIGGATGPDGLRAPVSDAPIMIAGSRSAGE